jgi:hypothetical protein
MQKTGTTQKDTEFYMDKWTKQAKNYSAYYSQASYLSNKAIKPTAIVHDQQLGYRSLPS